MSGATRASIALGSGAGLATATAAVTNICRGSVLKAFVIARTSAVLATLSRFSIAWALVKPAHGAVLVGLVLMLVNRLSGLVFPVCTQGIVDKVIGQHRLSLLPRYVIVVAAASVIQASCAFALSMVLSKSAQRLIAHLRIRAQAHIGRLPLNYYERHRTGELVANVINDLEFARVLVDTGVADFLGGLLSASVALLLMFLTAPRLTLAMMALLVVLLAGMSHLLGSLRSSFEARRTLVGRVTNRFVQSLEGVRIVKSYVAEAREAAAFKAGATELLGSVLSIVRQNGILSFWSTLVFGAFAVLLIGLGTLDIVAGRMTLGQFTTFGVLFGIFVTPLSALPPLATQMGQALVSLTRLSELLQEPTEDADPNRNVRLGSVRGSIAFERVRFRYDAGSDWVLNDVSFRAEPNTVTALVGPSGAGKSTIISLIAGFYPTTQGRVLIDGVDLNRLELAGYRKNLGIVLQEATLFDGSILENVAFARPSATRAEVIQACESAGVHEFAVGAPQGYDTPVGERGSGLSGGQRQRIAIARAILVDPKLLILDEPTSNLDVRTEALVQQALTRLMKGRTTVVVAHRLSTIRHADQIIYLDHGQIAEQGSHPSLLARKGRYYESVALFAGASRPAQVGQAED
jgi:ABC-type multidrug transport system fused ATPase/permease subunit